MNPNRESEVMPEAAGAMEPALLHEFFDRAVQRWPERVAVDVAPGFGRPDRTRLTYAELDAAAGQLAGRLRAFIPGECVVGILLPRTDARQFAAQLAVLRCGAAYTCLDPSFPDERVHEILNDAGVEVVVTDRAGAARVSAGGSLRRTLIDVGATGAALPPAETSRARPPWLTPQSLAYVIYTSGTTGRPKGVMIEHAGIANLVGSDGEVFRLSPADRVAQSSSSAYDSSVEETWLALAAGATLVVMDDATARLGPDLIAWLRDERITVFCPPPTLLRATGCSDPATALPELKLLYVGGEALPRDVADRWAQGRVLVNGYGPTECSVTCLRERIVAGAPITIGRPVRGVQAWVLDEAMAEVAPGTSGELCIGGPGLARGYWQRPELTAEKFPTHPRLGRLYRTGDLVHQDETGRFFYHGRIDAQVKLRGYRIELGEIETRLAAMAGVRAAACRVQEEGGHATLVAFVVPTDPASPPEVDELKLALGKALPAYMVPGRIGFLPELPTTVGGKLNRAALPFLSGGEVAGAAKSALPRNDLESRIHAAFAGVLGVPHCSLDADFFNDLGGDSLSAAQLVTALRDDPVTAWATVRDIYEARSVAALAARAPGHADHAGLAPTAAAAPPTAANRRQPWQAGLVQAAWTALSLVSGSAFTYAIAFDALPWAVGTLGVVPLVVLAPPLVLAGLGLYAVLAVAVAAGLKRLIIGTYRAGRAPVWGSFYVRNWIVQKAVRLVPWWLLEGTEFQIIALRALGARIGRRVHLHHGVDLLRGGWDLLEIGDDVTVGQDVVLSLVNFEAGQICFGAVTLGRGATLETHAQVGAGASVGENGYLTARASVPPGVAVPAGECWTGIPARAAGRAPVPPVLPPGEEVVTPVAQGIGLVLARLGLLLARLLPFELCALGAALFLGVDAEKADGWLTAPTVDARLLAIGVALAVVPLPLMLVVEALACRVMGPVRPGVISRWSWSYLRVDLKAGLLDVGSRWLYGTLFWPAWLRLAGMKVGPGCEISSLIGTVPELVEIGERTFCADGIYLGGAQIHRGTVVLARTRIGRNSFFGNGAIIPGGTQLPDEVLLGICTVAEQARIRPGTSWFGDPPFELPRREVIQLDRRLTHDPTAARYVVRGFWEVLRFALPAIFTLVGTIWYAALAAAEASWSLPAFLLVAVPLLNLAALAAPAGFVVALKWGLLGRVRPGVHPLWSSWPSRWDFFCLAWNIYAEELVQLLDGTPGLAWLLRATGVRVGRGVVLGTGFAEDLPDPDLLILEDGATVDCLFQAHTFEDRVLKMDYVRVRRDATVGRGAVLLYGADIGVTTQVAGNSVVMKHERLLPGLGYEGVPTRPRVAATAGAIRPA